ncbi:bifunctional tetrahydrofolate synthase/dihydrofolate synthase [Haemophilus parahaemolyticus]|uniref:Dihydrofolate synthase/folylpolyglutamate synthase n=2 Tax=Haemophilus parahaemolyticus TaxID=735 RepID=A0AAE6JS36_HAEPH|nr:bifunctional tetrahydrofolate synthase/dihydrofolate synthase [Haemophilus parahaemolyticus]EIJ72855.1 bifunctional protein FolC [Haemophilus parahaemolyticus HK385]OOR97458.1 bifunctional tetrahydrofolate synthase/dihydrofolate synthase [Haemophilus parahaemolyticus]QEN11630.1 bifunctional tetrahydrofolate synthase/dihydrofolate synthase [Haemophilus parahaemolyticus]QRP12832.1 bifunctional tetrahydrofolate synthase/dihydrofolate synthase [Haemophilus parahaemolyticus]STO66342.1 bifunction
MNSQTPTRADNLQTWLDYLEHGHFKAIDMGLDRIKSVASNLDLLHPAPYVITVAGTNGKGSTCRFLEVALMKLGLKVGVYSSPHLLRYNERVRINGQLLDDQAHIDSFTEIDQNKTASLTYFEFSTLSALKLFKDAKLDVVILEVGLGGRLDATNIVDPNLAVITSIDIDHVAFLGNNREDIGREKAGIFRANIPVIIGEPDCPQSILAIAQDLNAQKFQRNVDWQYEVNDGTFYWQSKTQQFNALPMPLIPIPNAGSAIATLLKTPFNVSEQVIRETLQEAQMTGRFQQLQAADFAHFSGQKPKAQVIIDVGHNPHAARYLAERLQAVKKAKIFAIFSCLEDKGLSGIVQPLREVIDEWHCVGLDCWRGQSGQAVFDKLVNVLPNATACVYENVDAIAPILFEQAEEQDIILVFGSFHTVADFVLFLEK